MYTAAQFVTDLESPYAWPGGYPRFFLCSDGECLSFAAAEENKAEIIDAITDGSNCGWRVVACDVNWEDVDMTCAHTGELIESAYGERMEYVAGTNIPGYMPDSEPCEFASFDEAKRYLISCLKHEEECQETEEEAEALCHFAEEVNLQSREFSAQCLGMVYWVSRI